MMMRGQINWTKLAMSSGAILFSLWRIAVRAEHCGVMALSYQRQAALVGVDCQWQRSRWLDFQQSSPQLLPHVKFAQVITEESIRNKQTISHHQLIVQTQFDRIPILSGRFSSNGMEFWGENRRTLERIATEIDQFIASDDENFLWQQDLRWNAFQCILPLLFWTIATGQFTYLLYSDIAIANYFDRG